MHLLLEHVKSPVSPLLLVTDADGVLRALEFGNHEERLHQLMREHYGEVRLRQGKSPVFVTRALEAYFDGNLDALNDLKTAATGTPFRQEVWKALRAIRAGTTISYGQLAARIGRPNASRAVGAANGANPIGIVVPCHRVIGANGKLTGYAGGLDHKKWLLDHEARFAAYSTGHQFFNFSQGKEPSIFETRAGV